jgi:DNA sulfur modification protein DndD
VQLQAVKVEIARAENSFAAHGGAFARNRDQLIQQEGILKERISKLEETIRQHSAGLLPFALVPGLCARLKEQILNEEQSTQVKAGQALLQIAKSEIVERLEDESLLANLKDISQKVKIQIRDRITTVLGDPLRVEKIQFCESVHQLSEATSRALLGWIEQAMSNVVETMNTVSADLERAYRELHKVAEAVRRVPTDDVLRPVLDEMHRFNETLVKRSAEIILQDQSIKEAELKLSECERRHTQLAHKLAAEAKYSGNLSLLPRVQGTLEEYRLKLIEKKVTQLQHSVTQCDVTGDFCTSRSERESLTRRKAGHVNQEVQSGTDRDIAATDRSGNRERKDHPASLQGS